LVLWHPRGTQIWRTIEQFWTEAHLRRGYGLVKTPHVARIHLWDISGHTSHYREMMYSPMEVEGQRYLLKPMNCPFHIQIYKSRLRSYRDLPLRYAEMGTVYRYERSGVLHGLLRVRGFTQDDAHIFCTPDQVEQELIGVLDLVQEMMDAFGYQDVEIELAVRDQAHAAKYLGEDAGWERAEQSLVNALKARGLRYVRGEGEAKFYGPSIDIKLLDSLGRPWQGPTIQFDFNLPERLGVTYVGADGREHSPLMIHRTVLGAMERFIGGLVEHYGGAFPLWLAPVQTIVLSITDDQRQYARKIADGLRGAGFRVEVDDRNEKIGFKIREAETQKIPFMIVVGAAEAKSETVSVRRRKEGDLGKMTLEELLSRIETEQAARK
jgi:threonyl-tRNA synthetase